MSKERALLVRAFTAIDSRDFPVLCKEIEELLAQPEQEPTNHMHEIFLHNLQNKEKLGEMIINLDDQYITLLGHKVVITKIIDREAYPVLGYFIDLNKDGETRINETEWDKNGDSAYCLGWRWGLTLDTSPNSEQTEPMYWENEKKALLNEIDHLTNRLAQPEQTPDYYLWSDEVHEEHPTNEGDDDVMELYLAPPKREPLSDGTTADMWHANKKATHADSYWAGVSDAEKAHKIGIR